MEEEELQMALAISASSIDQESSMVESSRLALLTSYTITTLLCRVIIF